MARWSTVQDIFETPDAPGGFEPTIEAGYERSVVRSSPFSALAGIRTRNYEPARFKPPPKIFPTVVVLPQRPAASILSEPDIDDKTVVFEEEDPIDYGETSVPEPRAIVPRVLAKPSILDPIPDYPYGSIPPVDARNEPVAEWSTIFSNVAAAYVGARYAPSPVRGLVAAAQPVDATGIGNTVTINPAVAAAPGVVMQGDCSTCPTTGPRYAKICVATGEISPLRRRRRRRLLTAGDLSDIASLKAIVGGGAALNAAVVKAMK